MPRKLIRLVAVPALFAGLVFAAPAARAESADALAKRLAKLRAEVEGLSEDLSQQKTDARNELQALARQKSDLKVELDREQVRVAKLRSALDKKREKIQETSAQGEDLAPVYDAAFAGMRRYVNDSLPFRRAERLGELDKIDEQRRSGVLSYPRALVRLWGFVEDELRMTHESAAFQQTISVDGEEKLAQVVRVGMVMLFYQTNDGEVGYTTKSGGEWKFVVASNGDQRKQIRTLFDSFKKQIRVGLFHVPNALPPVTR